MYFEVIFCEKSCSNEKRQIPRLNPAAKIPRQKTQIPRVFRGGPYILYLYILLSKFTQLPLEFLHPVYCSIFLIQLAPRIQYLCDEKSLLHGLSLFLT